jgi:hypothetical protein
MSPLHGKFGVGVVVRVGALVECHDDVRAEVLLDRDGLLRCEAVRRTVDMALEGYTVVVDLAGLRQGKDLKPARVGQHGTMPLHELVQAAHVAHKLISGPQIEMIRIAQHERSIDVPEMLRGQGLDRCLRTHRGKDRRDEVTMRGGKNPCAGAVVFGCDVEFEHAGNYNGRARRLEIRDERFMSAETSPVQNLTHSSPGLRKLPLWSIDDWPEWNRPLA